MKRRQFLKRINLFSLSVILFNNCSEKGIIGPDKENKDIPFPKRTTLITHLSHEPQAIWSPSGNNILYCKDEYFKIIDIGGLEKSDIKVLGDDEKQQKIILFPNWEGDNILYQINLKDNTSEVWQRYSFGGIPKKLNFGLGEGKYEFPVLSHDEKFIAFTFNNKMYLSEYPPKGISNLIPVNEKINYYTSWIGMYNWCWDGRLAFVVKKSTRGSNLFITNSIEKNDNGLINIDKIDIMPLTADLSNDYNPSWSPDGDYIVFDSNREAENDEHDIYIIKTDGTNLERLTDGFSFTGVPSEKRTIKSSELKNEIRLNSVHNIYPKFHPYNNSLLYSSRIIGKWTIHLIDNFLNNQK